MNLVNVKDIVAATGAQKRTVSKRLKNITPEKLEPHPGNPIRWYRIEDLPEDYQAALEKQALLTIPTITPSVALLSPVVARALPAKQTLTRLPVASSTADAAQLMIRDARLGIVNVIMRASEMRGITVSRSINLWLEYVKEGVLVETQLLWCAMANDKNGFEWDVDWSSGQPVGVPATGQDLHKAAKRLSRNTLFRWVRTRSEQGDDALIPKKRSKDMSIPKWAPYFLAEMQRPQKPSVMSAYENMARGLHAEGWTQNPGNQRCSGREYPGYCAVRRWYNEKYGKLDAQRGRNTGSALNPHKFCHTRTNEGMWPLLEVHSDGWNTHFTAPHPISGKFVTFEIWHSHDVATRKAYVHEHSIGLSESMIVILGSLYAVCSEDGEPIVWQTDNTGSVKNDRVEFDPVTSLAARRGMSIVHNTPGNSQANGIAENFNKYLDSRAKELATYQGKGMDSLAHKRVFKITQKMVKAQSVNDFNAMDKLQVEAERAGCGLMFKSFAEAVQWIKRVVSEFNDMPHRALPKITDQATGKKRHMTPNERMDQFVSEGWERKPLSSGELDDVFRVHERKKVFRGRVRIMHQDYHHPDMDNMNGEEVMVAYDIEDGGRVWIKDLSGAEICEAKFYASRGFRMRSFYEIAIEKRVDNQLMRLNKKAEDIEAQRPSNLLEHESAINLPSMSIDRIPEPEILKAESSNIVPLLDLESDERPWFRNIFDRYEWLMKHKDAWTKKDAIFLLEHVDTEKYADMIKPYSFQGIAWTMQDDEKAQAMYDAEEKPEEKETDDPEKSATQ